MADFSPNNLINQVVQATNSGTANINKASADLGATADQMLRLFTQSEQGTAAGIEEAQQVAVNKATTDFAQAKKNEMLQNLYGMNPDSENFVIAKRMTEVDAAQKARAPIKAEYDALSQVDFLTNPLGWIIAQTALPQVAAKNNAFADVEDNALMDIQNRQTLLAASKSAVAANTADEVRANQVAAAHADTVLANAKLAQTAGDNLGKISAIQLSRANLANVVGDNQVKAATAIATIEQAAATRQLQREAADRANKVYDEEKPIREARLALAQETLAKAKESEEERTRLNTSLAAVSGALGHRIPMTIDTINKLAKPEEQAAWLAAARSYGFGSTFGDSVTFFLEKNTLGNMDNVSLQRTAQSFKTTAADSYLNFARAKLSPPVGSQAKQPTEAEVRAEAYTMYALDQMKAMSDPEAKTSLSDRRWDKTFNVYVAPAVSFSNAIDTLPQYAALKDNAVKKQIDILKAAEVVHGDNITSNQFAQIQIAIQALVANRQLDPKKAAADISSFYVNAAQYNIGQNQYNLLALPPQSNYYATIPRHDKKVDLFNPVEVENALSRVIMESERRKQGADLAGNFPN